MFTLSKDRSKKGKELRMVVVETLQDMMKSDAQVVAMEADLGGASGLPRFRKAIRTGSFSAVFQKQT